MAAVTVPYTKLMLIQRIRKFLNNGFISDDYSTSDNEILLMIDEAVAVQIKSLAFENAKMEGVLMVPEAFLVTFNLTLTQDPVSNYWYTTLPQPPLSLPLGYSITRAYFATGARGQSQEILPIKAKRVGYRTNLPMPTGVRYWVEGLTMWLAAYNNAQLGKESLYVQMPINRTSDTSLPMNLPDDIIENLFVDVTGRLAKRNQMPRDIVKDDLPAGNNNIKSGGEQR
jgi:hypothetical protein